MNDNTTSAALKAMSTPADTGETTSTSEQAQDVQGEQIVAEETIILNDTTTDSTDTQDSETEHKPLSQEPVEKQAEAYKSLARKHEKRSVENYKMLKQVQEQYEAKTVENAMLKARLNHPELTEEDFKACPALTAEGIEEWVTSQMAFLERHQANNENVSTTATTTQKVDDTAQALNRAGGPQPPQVATTREQAYKTGVEETKRLINARKNNPLFKKN